MPWVRLNTVNSVYLISCPRSSRSQEYSRVFVNSVVNYLEG